MGESKHSHKDYTNRSLAHLPASDFSNTTLTGTCLSQEIPDSEIFPKNVTGLTLVNCNADNVLLPAGTTVVGGSRRRYQVQKDRRDWEVDSMGNPTAILNESIWVKDGYSVDPTDIPDDKVIHVDAMKLEVLSGEKTLAEVIGPEEFARLTAKLAEETAASDAEGLI